MLSRRLLISSVASLALAGPTRAQIVRYSRMTRSAHNGGRSQVNLWSLLIGDDYPFINHLKTAQSWALADFSTAPAPDTLDVNGYPIRISNGGVATLFFVPTPEEYSGNWIITWDGDGTIALSVQHTTISGSKSGHNGRYICRLGNRRVDFRITATNPGNHLRNVKVFRADHEGLITAGEVFTPLFKQKLLEARFGVCRFLDWQNGNQSNVTVWADKKPIDYVFYQGHEFKSRLYAGTASNIGDDYAIGIPGFTLADKATVILKFSADANSSACTLNVNDIGAIPMRNACGDSLFSQERPKANRYCTLIYDRDLNVWLKHGGDVARGNVGLSNGAPPEIMVRLCDEVGMHPWFCQPYLTADPITDYMSSLAAYCREMGPSWMVPRYEAPNETWNSANGFYATRYGWNKAFARWAVKFDHHNWYGMVLSTLGQAVSAAYGKDRTKYQVICGVQTFSGATSASNDQLNSTRYVKDGGSAAKNWATHVACANYYNATYTDKQEIEAAFNYAVADSARKLVIATDYANSTLIDGATNNQIFGIPNVARLYTNWGTWARGLNLGLTGYEGGYSPDYPARDSSIGITGATKAAQCVITAKGHAFIVGMQASFANVGGMTELNGKSSAVVAVTADTFAIDLDSTAFSAYTSGGNATYVNSRIHRTTLRAASKQVASLEDITTQNLINFLRAGGEFPSCYVLSGRDNAWSVFDPDIYATPSPQWKGIVKFNSTIANR